MVGLLGPRPLRFPERAVLRWHLDLGAAEKLLDREDLHARVVPTPPLRAVVPRAQPIGVRPCWLLLLKVLQSRTQTYEGGVSL
jgi:hypothetical protein